MELRRDADPVGRPRLPAVGVGECRWWHLVLAAAVVLACASPLPRLGLLDRAPLGVAWLALVVGLCVGGRLRGVLGAVASFLVLGAWAVHPAAWVLGALMLVVALGVQTLASERGDRPRAVEFVAPGLAVGAPLLLSAVVLLTADAGAAGLATELEEAWPRDITGWAALVANGLGVWVSFAVVADARLAGRRTRCLVGVLVMGGLVLLAAARAHFMASTLGLPAEHQWSESPHLLNLLKLERGVPLYGPLEDCNSYSYSPLLELAHHTLLAPFGSGLSLPANRSLSLIWQGASVAILVWAFWSSRALEPKRWPLVVGTIASLWLVVTSSFLASTLHSDHLTMLAFSLAIALVVAERSIPRWLLWTGLLVVPVFATMVKLTGAGVGLGLVVAFLWPLRWGPLLWLAASGILALSSIALYDATLGPFSAYAIGLQASHPIRWGAWHAAWLTPPGRWFMVAVVAVVVAWFATYRLDRRSALPKDEVRLRDAIRLVGLTTAFMVPSLVAYLKVGGRVNSLLPMTIGAAAVLLQLAPLVPWTLRSTVLAPGALCMLCGVVPPVPVPSTAERRAMVVRHTETVALVKQELDRGRRTLVLGDIAAWIDGGGRGVPLDLWQTVGELDLGGHKEAEAFFRRVRDGYYQSIVMSRHVLLERYSRSAPRLRQVLKTHFVLVTPESMPAESEVVPLLFRRR